MKTSIICGELAMVIHCYKKSTRYTEMFTAYLKGYKQSPLRINFRQGIELEDGSYDRGETGIIQCDIDLEAYVPKGAACFIQYGLEKGWNPKDDIQPFIITDAQHVLDLLRKQVTIS